MVFKKMQRSNRNFLPRKMVQGSWICTDCGKEITELPFEPKPDQPIYCRDCWQKRRGQKRRNFGKPRQMVQGNWICTKCGKEITELPFEPKPDQPIYCRDCWQTQKSQQFEQ